MAVAGCLLASRTAVPILSYDDIYRTLFAHQWSEQPYFFTERLVWLPFPLMVTGAVMRITGEAFWTALGVNVAASGVAIWYVHRLTSRFFGPLGAWLAASLFGLTPWVLFLSLSRYSEPLFMAAIAVSAFHWCRWTEGRSVRDLAVASVALTAAVLSRYEAWPLALVLPIHVVIARARGGGGSGREGPFAALPLIAVAIWVGKNLSVYGTPVYGGAFGFLPASVPAGAWSGARLSLESLWQLNALVSLLGLAGLVLGWRRAPVLGLWLGLGVVVPWYTVSFFPVEVVLPSRLLMMPLMLLAVFAGATVDFIHRRNGPAFALIAGVIAVQFAAAARAGYPSTPLPMTRLALHLDRSGLLDRFDDVLVQSPGPLGYPDEVRVATNFRRPVHLLPVDSRATDWQPPPEQAVMVLNDGQSPPGDMSGAFVLSRVDAIAAWGICRNSASRQDRVDWVDVVAPPSARATAEIRVAVKVRNGGAQQWSANACGATLGARWLGADGRRIGDEIRLPLPAGVEPGRTVQVVVAIPAPPDEGRLTLELAVMGHRGAVSGTGVDLRQVMIELSLFPR